MARSATLARRLLLAIIVLVLALMAVAAQPSPARADTVYAVINLPAEIVDNRCNGETVVLNGDLHMLVTTTPTSNGGSRVRSVTVTEGLQGTGATSGVAYRAVAASLAFINYVPPPGTGTFYNLHTTVLVPQGDAPAMLLVVVLKGTVASDGTILSEIERSYLLCHPRRSAGRAS